MHFLKQKLAGVRDFDISHIFTRPTVLTPRLVLQKAAGHADTRRKGIGRMHQTLHNQIRSTVGNQTVTFHFSQTQTAVTRSTLGWLARQNGPRTTCTRMHFVKDHVLELLVKNWTRENVRVQYFSSCTRIQTVLAGVVHSVTNQCFRSIFG